MLLLLGIGPHHDNPHTEGVGLVVDLRMHAGALRSDHHVGLVGATEPSQALLDGGVVDLLDDAVALDGDHFGDASEALQLASGLDGHRGLDQRPDLPAASQVIVPSPAPKPSEPKVKAAPSLRIQLVDLSSGQCKWPEGDGPFTFCGHRRHADTPYCREHAAMARASNGPMGGGSGESMARALRKFL